MRRIAINDTTLSDSTHGLRKSVLTGEDILSLAESIDAVGFDAAEAWGGATFDNCLRYLNENPWDRLRILSARMPHTPLRIIVRGQNLLGYRPMPLDVIRAFAAEIAGNGIRVVRIFDPLNDLGNLEIVIPVFLEAGVAVEGTIVYTQSPVHSVAGFTAMATRLASLGCVTLCINDVAGILTPTIARPLVREISAIRPVSVHCRSVTGMGAMAYVAALENGAAGIDCAISPFAMSASQPTIESMLEAFDGGEFETGIDRKALKAYMKKAEIIAMRHTEEQSDPHVIQSLFSVHKIPFGMLSGIISELHAVNAVQRVSEVLAEVTRVREDLGWPPLITPLSQMIQFQAMQNILRGRRYAMVSQELKDYLKGFYGTPPGEVNPELAGAVTRISGRAALLLPSRMETLTAELKAGNFYEKPEDVVTYALYGPLALSYFLQRRDPSAPRPVAAARDNNIEILTAFMERRRVRRLEIDGKDFRIKLVRRGPSYSVSGAVSHAAMDHGFAVEADNAGATDNAGESAKEAASVGPAITAPLGGTFYRSASPGQPPLADVGSAVTEETVIGLIEAMKLFHEVKAEKTGVIKNFAVDNGGMVERDGVIAHLAAV